MDCKFDDLFLQIKTKVDLWTVDDVVKWMIFNNFTHLIDVASIFWLKANCKMNGPLLKSLDINDLQMVGENHKNFE